MVNFSAKFVGSNPGHWELYADGVRVYTFSVKEIAGVYENNKSAVDLICAKDFGMVIEGCAKFLSTSSMTLEILNQPAMLSFLRKVMLPFLCKVIQTHVEASGCITKEVENVHS